MFTGIVQTIGIVRAVATHERGTRFTIEGGELAAALVPGDSVSINGACHTVESRTGKRFTVTSVGETLARTTMGDLRSASRVNLEPSATPDTALGGHIVQGHVDGVGRVVSFTTTGRDRMLTLELTDDVYAIVVDKGSIAIDGVSLTVVERLPGNRITITIIPFTIEHTIIGDYRAGTRVNLEADVIGKYVLEYVRRLQPESA